MARMNWKRAAQDRRPSEALYPTDGDEPHLPRRIRVRRRRAYVESPEVRARIEATRAMLDDPKAQRLALIKAAVERRKAAVADD